MKFDGFARRNSQETAQCASGGGQVSARCHERSRGAGRIDPRQVHIDCGDIPEGVAAFGSIEQLARDGISAFRDLQALHRGDPVKERRRCLDDDIPASLLDLRALTIHAGARRRDAGLTLAARLKLLREAKLDVSRALAAAGAWSRGTFDDGIVTEASRGVENRRLRLGDPGARHQDRSRLLTGASDRFLEG
jgi:hypothetical protein